MGQFIQHVSGCDSSSAGGSCEFCQHATGNELNSASNIYERRLRESFSHQDLAAQAFINTRKVDASSADHSQPPINYFAFAWEAGSTWVVFKLMAARWAHRLLYREISCLFRLLMNGDPGK